MNEQSGSKEFSLNYKEQCAVIGANGNRPEDWRSYIDFLKRKIDLLDEKEKYKMISFMYYSAVKSIPDSCKSYSRAQLYIEYAEFKRPQNPDEAKNILTVARRTLRHHSNVHIACAEFELIRGCRDIALKILCAARSYGSSPQI